MPKPMKVKIFMDEKASVIEDQINAWLRLSRFGDYRSNGNGSHRRSRKA